MFSDAHTDGLQAIMRKKAASLMVPWPLWPTGWSVLTKVIGKLHVCKVAVKLWYFLCFLIFSLVYYTNSSL